VTFVNRSGKLFDPSMTSTTASSGEVEADEVYQDDLGTPSARVLPGKKVSFWIGHGVQSDKKFTITVPWGSSTLRTRSFGASRLGLRGDAASADAESLRFGQGTGLS
jgi:hypothetical protein